MSAPILSNLRKDNSFVSNSSFCGIIEKDLHVRTTFMSQSEFDQRFQLLPPPKFSLNLGQRLRKKLRCFQSVDNFINFICSFLPILQWLPRYSWRENLPGDFMAGVTIGVVHVPQGIAYAILTGVDPVYGLYTCFFAVLFYMVFGTSRHVSIGTFAIVSLMTATSCRNIYAQIENEHLEAEIRYLNDVQLLETGNILNFNNITKLVPRKEVEYKELVQTITLTAGLIQIVMAILRVEFLASYLSDQLVNAFCTGAAVHVVMVQLGKLAQLEPRKHSGPGYLFWILYDLCSKFSNVNGLALGISLGSFAFLYIGKDLLNPKVRKCLPMPLPFELLLMIAVTVVSTIADFKTANNITVVNNVPTGLPVPHLPRLDLIPYVLGDALEIAFVVVALHLSMCKVFNRRMGSKTDNNLELYALGLIGSFSSFFNTYPVSSALGRSMLIVECGAKTQLASLFAALLLLVVILFLGPLLSCLPMCVLAAIIIFSMKSAFTKMPNEVLHLWRVAKIDFLIWIVTFVSTVILNVMQGLAVSVIFALMTTVFRIQWPRWCLLSNLSGTEYYRDSGRYGLVSSLGPGIKIFRFDAPLLFTNVEHFSYSMLKAVYGSSGAQELGKSPENGNAKASSEPRRTLKKITLGQKYHTPRNPKPEQNLIVDCTGFTFVDYTSVNALADLFHQITDGGTDVFFAGAKTPVRDMFELCGFFNSVPREQFFPTIHDAVLAARNKKKWHRRKRGYSEMSLKKTSPNIDDSNSLCIGEKELFLSSFKNLTLVGTPQFTIEEEEENCCEDEEASDV